MKARLQEAQRDSEIVLTILYIILQSLFWIKVFLYMSRGKVTFKKLGNDAPVHFENHIKC